MTKYSHTQLSTFRTCRLQYRFRYIDRIRPESRSVETFMGSLVHEAMEKLYNDLRFGRTDEKRELLDFFDSEWEKGMSVPPRVAKPDRTLDDYRSLGRKCISDYYDSHVPFDDMKVLGVETDDVLELPDGNTFYVRIDKLACVGTEYYVCDYKTNGRMKTQQEADADRQLAMYSAWVRKAFPDATAVHLLWHMLVFDKDVVSDRTQEQIDALIEDAVSTIAEIQSCTEFPPTRSALCDYCDFRGRCPEFVHLEGLTAKSPEELSEDDGVKLVDRLQALDERKSSLKADLKDLEKEMDDTESEIARFAESYGLTTVYGTECQSSVRKDVSYSYEADKEEVVRLLKEKGMYDSYSMLNSSRFRSDLKKGLVDPEVSALAQRTETVKVGLAKRKDKGER